MAKRVRLYDPATNADAITAAAGAGTVLTGTASDPVFTASPAGLTSVSSKVFTTPPVTLTYAATTAVNWANGLCQKITLTGNVTFTFSNPVAGAHYLLEITQDTTGSRTVTWPTIRWQGGSAPTLTTTASKTDLIVLIYDGTSYFGQAALNF